MLLYTEYYAALLITFSIARFNILRMKPIVRVFKVKTLTILYKTSNLQHTKNYIKTQLILLMFVTAMLYKTANLQHTKNYIKTQLILLMFVTAMLYKTANLQHTKNYIKTQPILLMFVTAMS